MEEVGSVSLERTSYSLSMSKKEKTEKMYKSDTDVLTEQSHKTSPKATDGLPSAEPEKVANVSKKTTSKWSLFHKDKDEQETKQVQRNRDYSELTIKNVTDAGVTEVKHFKKVTPTELLTHKELIGNTAELLKNKNTAAFNALKSAESMIQGLIGYSNIIVQRQDLDANLLQHTNIISAMMSHIHVSIAKAKSFLDEDSDGLKEVTKLEDIYMLASNRLTAEVNSAKKMSDSDEDITWYDIITASMIKKTVDVSQVESKDILGNAMSKVYRVKENGETSYLKGDEKIIAPEELLMKALTMETDSVKELILKYSEFFLDVLREGYMENCSMDADFDYKLDVMMNIVQSREPRLNMLYFRGCVLSVIENIYKITKSFTIYASIMKIKSGEYTKGRNVAVTVAANLLGVSDVVVANEEVTIIRDGEETSGFSMSEAKGVDFDHIDIAVSRDKTAYSGEFQRQMFKLQIFDSIMGQTDRHINNMFYQIEEKDGKKQLTRVTGIDNDTCAGLTTDLTKEEIRRLACIDELGYFTLSVMDAEMYEYMRTLHGKDGNCEVLKESLKGLMGEEYINAIETRFKMIMSAIEKTKKEAESKGNKFLYKADEWGSETLDKMISKDDSTITYLDDLYKASNE